MKKITFCLLALCATGTQAADEELSITVESTRLSDVSGEEVKSADVADALSRNVPGISLVRRSGIANDVILRGQKKDNINILIDDAKVYGACPNRMDPPTSHMLANNIEGIEIIEGPYDVESFGTLSGAVKVTTRQPSKELHGEVNLNAGSWGYRKAAASVSGGGEKVRMLVSMSKEQSDQYQDGDGNNFYDQIANLNLSGPPSMVQYKDMYKDQAAYEKRTFMGKAYIDVSENQQLNLSYTANRSDDILYPSSKMDALYDNSDIINVDYTIANLGDYSKKLEIKFYDTQVEHPMSTYYRKSSGLTDSANEMISALTTAVQGIKVINAFDLSSSSELRVGVDTSKRNWDGSYEAKGTMVMMNPGQVSIDDVDTTNRAVFAELESKLAATSIKFGLRYDDTEVKTAGTLGQPGNEYTGISANIFANYPLNDSTKLFGGIGRANRVPDARELYFNSAQNVVVGTPTLNQTTNTEVDLGVEKRYQNGSVKAKLFYSQLTDYIYFNSSKASNSFENIDATIRGVELSGAWFATDTVSFDYGVAYQMGEKDAPLAGQTDTDLAEIPPMKSRVVLNYDYAPASSASIELISVAKWDHYDSDNGEQAMDGYSVVNLKAQHAINQSFEVTVGVDNALDTTYAATNTYKDLTLLADGAGDVMLMNEPGRYVYVNARYKF
jgi:iron complex outermembrane receptor protein